MIYVKHLMQFDDDEAHRLRQKISGVNAIIGQFIMEHPDTRRISDRRKGIKVGVPILNSRPYPTKFSCCFIRYCYATF